MESRHMASSFSFLRVIVYVSVIPLGCHSYRPDGDGAQKLSVAAKGHLTASMLQQSSGSQRSNVTAEGSGEKCVGEGNGWKCEGSMFWAKEGAPRDSGSRCKVKCENDHNMTAKDTSMETHGVLCTDGRYDIEPECIQRVQCDNGGGGWTCKEHKPDIKKLNLGQTCSPVCAEPDFVPIHTGQSKCIDEGGEGKLVPETGCRQLNRCPAKNEQEGWVCTGEMGGKEQVASGQACHVQCSGAEGHSAAPPHGAPHGAPSAAPAAAPPPGQLVPLHDSVTCQDGKYVPEHPSCVTADQKKAQDAKEAATKAGTVSADWSRMLILISLTASLIRSP